MYAWAFVKQFLDVPGYDEVKLKSDNEPTTKFIREEVAKLRVPKKTLVTTSGNCAHEELEAAERAHQTAQAQIRALRTQYEKDSGCLLRPGQILFTWMVRHAGWALTRLAARAASDQTAYEKSRSKIYSSPLVKFGEVVMARVPTDIRACKLESLWVKGAWVGRTEGTDEHVLLAPKRVLRTRAVRRLPERDYFDRISTESCKGRPWDAMAGCTAFLKPTEIRKRSTGPDRRADPERSR